MDKMIRRIEQSPIYHGDEESAPYTLDTAPWGGTPTNISVKVKLNGQDVSDDVLTGDPDVVSDIIILPVISGLTAGVWYRLEVKFTNTTNIGPLVAWADLIGQE